jgi:predicted DCC family thiol-disulfide oxidoreductase YuxK
VIIRTRPILLFDGDCGFCRRWARRWQRLTGDAVEYAPFQEAGTPLGLREEDLREAIHLVEPDGTVHRGAAAAYRAFVAGGRSWPWRAYEGLPGFAPVSEAVYRFVARHREGLSRIDRWLWGTSTAPATCFLTRRLFVRSLGLVYLAAFLSLAVQVQGLLGSEGILPAGEYLDFVAARAGGERYYLVPTWLWLGDSDTALSLVCWGGAAISLLVVGGVLPGPLLLLLWSLYLSMTAVGRTFLNYQWDALLLEIGFLAVFLAPVRAWPRLAAERPPSRIALWLLRWLLFRLMFLSGFVKLASGDAVWWNGTALDYHFWTQPLPTWTAWYAAQLPAGFLKGSVLAMFLIELAVPFLIFGPRRLRIAAFFPLAGLQIAILLTGNYGFFNLATLALCILLLDDRFLGRFYPRRVMERLPASARPSRLRRALLIPVAAWLLVTSSALFMARLGLADAIPRAAWTAVRWTQPLRSVSSYGLFANMTESRPEIVLEGSNDGVTWQTYEFRWKPGDPRRRPAFVTPHMPRLDWQMWFAPLRGYQRATWFRYFIARLFEGSPSVEGLLEHNPFPDDPPRYLRASLYEYRFAGPALHRQTGVWWDREWKGLFAPVFYNRNQVSRSAPSR